MFRRVLLCGRWWVVLLLCVLAVPSPSWSAEKLCLKDGTYQLVSSYEVHGGRVRYYSVERSEWEELPAALVDFDATRRAQEEEKAAAQKKIDEAKEIQQERFEKSPALGMEVAPGLRLPGDDGVFTVEGARVVRMAQSSAEIITDKKRAALALAVPLPVMRGRSLVVLEGAKATVRLSSPQPVFYVQSTDNLGARMVLVRVKAGKEARVVEQVEGARAGIGKGSEVRTAVPVDPKQVGPNLYKLKPLQPLEQGEYALGELVGQKLNLDVWDFGVDKWEVVK